MPVPAPSPCARPQSLGQFQQASVSTGLDRGFQAALSDWDMNMSFSISHSVNWTQSWPPCSAKRLECDFASDLYGCELEPWSGSSYNSARMFMDDFEMKFQDHLLFSVPFPFSSAGRIVTTHHSGNLRKLNDIGAVKGSMVSVEENICAVMLRPLKSLANDKPYPIMTHRLAIVTPSARVVVFSATKECRFTISEDCNVLSFVQSDNDDPSVTRASFKLRNPKYELIHKWGMEYEKGLRRNSARIDAYTELVFKALEEPTRNLLENEKITDEAKKNTWTLKVHVDFSQYQRPHRLTPETAAIKVSTISIVDPIQDVPLASTLVSIEALRLRSEYIDAVFSYREKMNCTSNPSLKLIEGSTLGGMLHFIEMLQNKKYSLEDVDSAIDAIQISDFIVMRPFAQKWLIPLIRNIELPEYFGARSIELAALLKMSPKTHDRDEFERLILERCEDSRELAAVASMSNIHLNVTVLLEVLTEKQAEEYLAEKEKRKDRRRRGFRNPKKLIMETW